MISKQLIQASANVIRITKLVKGDIVKVFEDSSYSDKLKYAVVLDIMNDGDRTAVEFLVYNKSYDEIKGDILVLSGDNEKYSLFPTTKEEMDADFEGLVERIQLDIKEAEKKVAEKKAMLTKLEQFLSGELSKKLTTPAFKEMTQSEFEMKKSLL